MLIRVAATIAWTIAFFLGAAVVAGFLLGLFFLVATSFKFKTDHAAIIHSMRVPMAWAEYGVGLVGLLLGVTGKLPGTKPSSGTRNNTRK
jgi:hypothetical protein